VGDAEGAGVTSRFGTLLRTLRQRAGLSQEALADAAGVGVRTIRGLETGERSDPRIGTVRLVADALDLAGDERAELFAAAGRPEDEPVPVRRPALADPLAEAADALAHAVQARWQREEEQRQVHDPVPLPVRWHPVPDDLRDDWANINAVPSGETAEPVDLTGQLGHVVAVYRRIRSGRLVVLGEAGAGKTVLTTRLVLDLLADRGPADPVPVVVSLGSWNPTAAGLRDWLAEQLVRDHPGLAAPGPTGATLAAALVDAHRVLPVLDGFDELAGGLHRPALAALNATTLPLVLTSRVDEYRAAVAATDVLTSAAAVELADLAAGDLADYLPRTTRRTGPAGTIWQPVIDEVRDHPDGAVAAALRTPLMVSLARRIYSDTPDHDPADLLGVGDRDAIERHLLGSVVPTAYPDSARARRALGFLADHLDRLDTRDLAWWRLGASTSRRASMLVVGCVVLVAVAITDVVVERLAGLGTTPLLLVFGTLIGLVAGISFGLAHRHALATQPPEPSLVRLRLRGRAGPRWPRARARARLGLLAGSVAGLTYGLVRMGAFWAVFSAAPPWLPVVIDAVLFTVVFGAAGATIFGLVAAAEAPLDLRSAGSPSALRRADRRTVLVQTLVFVPAFVIFVDVAGWLLVSLLNSVSAFDFAFTWEGTAGLVVGAVAGLGGGLGYTLGLTAWGQWLVFARLWLPLTGRLPWRPAAFLDDAYRRGVLRRAGAVYQFRHARLQDHLAAAYRGDL
jgi:transcriptional regulator with XRE-family HTH domain